MVGEKNMCGPPNEGGEVCFNSHMLTRMTKSMWSVAQKIMVEKTDDNSCRAKRKYAINHRKKWKHRPGKDLPKKSARVAAD